MNLAQYALMTYRTTGTGLAVHDFYQRAIATGEYRPATPREATRVLEFAKRVAKAAAASGLVDLMAEAETLAEEMERRLAAFTASFD